MSEVEHRLSLTSEPGRAEIGRPPVGQVCAKHGMLACLLSNMLRVPAANRCLNAVLGGCAPPGASRARGRAP